MTDVAPEEFVVLAWGLVSASVCTSFPLAEATRRLNLELPTGISSAWAPAAEPRFAGGEPNPGPCPDRPGFVHYLFHC